jgi:hypothetical protein
MVPEYDVVDLGTKHGGAIAEFLRRGNISLKDTKLFRSFRNGRCVGYEIPAMAAYRLKVESKGFKFSLADLATDEGIRNLPPSQVYLAWHFLEHVPDKSWSSKLVKASLSNANRLAWFRLPSFEQDIETGEGVLRKHGLRFTWTHWKGHPTHWLVQDCKQAIDEWAEQNPTRAYELEVRPAEKIRNVSDSRVVPISAPIDTTKYSASLGPKPELPDFKTAVVSAWEIVVRFKQEGELCV